MMTIEGRPEEAVSKKRIFPVRSSESSSAQSFKQHIVFAVRHTDTFNVRPARLARRAEESVSPQGISAGRCAPSIVVASVGDPSSRRTPSLVPLKTDASTILGSRIRMQ